MRPVLIVNAPSRAGVYGELAQFSAVEPPVWAGILASCLEGHGYRARIVDAEALGMDVEATSKYIREYRAALAVFPVYGHQPSASTQCLPGAEAVARQIDIPALALGTHPSALPVKTLEEGPWTYVAKGEGHRTVLGLVQALAGHGKIVSVPGLLWKEGELLLANSPEQPADDLTIELPLRGFHQFNFNRYRAHNWHAFGYASRSPYASLQTSLGCPFRCTFCCINAPFGGASIRFWSVENVLHHLDDLAARGVVHVKIPDEMFLLNPRHVESICDGIIARGHRFNFWAYSRVDTMGDEALLRKMKQAGFNWLAVGIESASYYVRAGVEKGRFELTDIRQAVHKAKKCGISMVGNYIFGLPDDTRDSMRATLDMACALNTEWANFYCAMAYPGSALHGLARQRKWALPEDPGGPGWIGYSQHAYETLPLPTEALTAAEVLAFRDYAHVYYFQREEYLSKLRYRFDSNAEAEVRRMLSAGTPRRKLLEVTG